MGKTVFLSVLLLVAAGCGGGSGSTPTTSDVSDAVPGDVVISSPTAEISASAALSAKVAKAEGDVPQNAPVDYMTKKNEMDALIAGEGECSFEIGMPTINEPECYGPMVDYENHPDSPIPGAGGVLPGNDLGIWNETEGDSQACAAAKMNALVDSIASRVDNAIKIISGMSCAGKKAGLALPTTEGDTIDFTSAMSSNIQATGLTISSATIMREANDSDGNVVYLSTIDYSMDIEGSVKTGSIILKHIPLAENNSIYRGKIATKMPIDLVSDCGGNTGGMPVPGPGVIAGTIIYNKSSAGSIVYQYNFGQFCGADTDPFDANLDIDPNSRYDQATNPTGWVHDWNYGLFSIDPTTGFGSVAYAWQAGYFDYRTRTFNITVSGTVNGEASGTAYYGFGPDVSSANIGAIDGFICNWAGPNGATMAGATLESRSAANLELIGRGVSKAQKQVITRAAGSQFFATTEAASEIRYAPRNACATDAGDGFIYTAQSQSGLQTFSNDRSVDTNAVLSELIDISLIDFVMPTPPSL